MASGQNPWLSWCLLGLVAAARGFPGICWVLSVAGGQNPRFSRYLLGPGSGRWPKPKVFMVFAGSNQLQVAKTHGFHSICRVLPVASGPCQWQVVKTLGFRGICRVLAVARGLSHVKKAPPL